MAPADVPEAFYRALDKIDDYTGTGSRVHAVIAELPAADRVTFARWWLKIKEAQRAKSIQEQQAKPAMQPAMYINSLGCLDFRHSSSISSFMYRTQIRDWEPYPEPIILGSEDGLVYRLRSQLLDLEPSCDVSADVILNDAISEIRATKPDTQCPLRFVLPLGTLDYIRLADSSRFETSFHVCINPVDRSIWLILAAYTLDQVGDRVLIPRGEDPWPYLGLKSRGRVQFDVMELMTWKEFRKLENQSQAVERDMFGLAEGAMQVWPTLWVATKEAVDAVVPRMKYSPQQAL